MRFFVLLSLLLVSCSPKEKKTSPEQQAYIAEAQKAQYELNLQFADKARTPLDSVDWAKFKSLDFFPIAVKYVVKARFEKNEYPVPFEMKTSTDRKPIYQKYGTLFFEMDGISCELACYQSLDPNDSEEEKQYVSVPFTDKTTGKESYGGGRYLDLRLPLADTVILNFNKVYNPYCAYSHRWSCVIPPEENTLPVAIKAGAKKFHD